ncbi:glycosyltransferase family 39 protein [Candidatus Woesearchaeota archaeon]|nr:glycosyltransferase family 39 protein [Candidatus Woesearchaeota archaeon]
MKAHTSDMKPRNILLILLITIALIRLPALQQLAYGDEYRFINNAMPHNEAGLIENFEMPPLPTWLNQLFSIFIDDKTTAARTASYILGLISILLIYAIAKKQYNEKTALLAATIFAFSLYATWAGTAIELNGANMLFAFLLAIYALVKTEENKKWVYLYGIATGIGMLSRYETVLFFPLFFANSLYTTKSWKTTIKRTILIGIIAGAIFAIFPILSYATHSNHFYSTIERGANMTLKEAEPFKIIPYLIQLSYALLWIALPFGAIFLLGLKNYENKKFKWYAWIVLVLLFYTFIVKDNYKPFDRYFTLLMPALLFIGINELTEINWKKTITYFIIAIIAIILLNTTQTQLPFYPKESYFKTITTLSWNFLIPFNGGSGPIGFLASFSGIALAFITSAIALILAIKNKTTAISLILAVSFALNLFLIQEFTLGMAHGNINEITKNAINYTKETTPKEQEVFYFRNWALKLYLNDTFPKLTNLDFFNDTTTNSNHLTKQFKNATIMWIDFPSINKQGALYQTVSQCRAEKTFSNTATIFRC